jgi:hypothetical protein
MQRSGARSIVSLDMIQKITKKFWTERRYHNQQHRWPKSPIEVNIAESIPTTTNRWEKSM